MYSSPPQSSVTVPWTLSRNDCAAGHWAASSRPVITTTSCAPKSIASITLPPLSMMRSGAGLPASVFLKRYPAFPPLRDVLVVPGVHQPADEVEAQPARPALLDGGVHVRVGGLRHVEGLHAESVSTTSTPPPPPPSRSCTSEPGSAAAPYLTMFVNNSSTAKSTGRGIRGSTPWRAKKPAVNSKISGSESKVRAKAAPRSRRPLPLHQDDRHVVLLRRPAGEGPDGLLERPAQGPAVPGMVVRDHLAHPFLAELLAAGAAYS